MRRKRYRFNLDEPTYKRIDALLDGFVRKWRDIARKNGVPEHELDGAHGWSRQSFVEHIVRKANVADAAELYDGGSWGNFIHGPTRAVSLPFADWELDKIDKVAGESGNRSAALRVIIALAEVDRL